MIDTRDDIQLQIDKFTSRLNDEDDPDICQMFEQKLADLRIRLHQTISGDGAASVIGAANAPITTGNANTVNSGGVITHDNFGIAAGENQGNVLLFSGGTNSSNIAKVINIYQQTNTPSNVDYGAALRRYLEHLYRQHATIDLRGIDERPLDMPLDKLYLSLLLYEPQVDDLRGPGALRNFVEKMRTNRSSFVPEADLAEPNDQKSEPIAWSKALQHQFLAVVGSPGSGKTTLLQYTTVRLAEILARDTNDQLANLGLDTDNDNHRRPPVPLLLPLRALGAYLTECGRRDTMAASPRLLLDCLHHFYNGFDLDLPADFFPRLCEAGAAMLLLDGLDEVMNTNDRAVVSAIVGKFATRYATCRYVVTARVASYQGDVQIGSGFHICTIADMSSEQQQQFILNWSRSVQQLLYKFQGTELDQAARHYTEDLWQALQMNDRVRELATNPLLLTVVAVVYHNNYVLPEDRAALYEECVEVLLRGGRDKSDPAAHERRQYSGKADLSMGLASRRELLAAVAYTMHQRGKIGRQMERHELIHTVAAHLPNQADASELAQTFVEELLVHIGLINEVQPNVFCFSHLSFQEFLAARHIAETDTWDDLLVHYQEDWWREIILLCAGYLSQVRCWHFLERLIAQGHTPAKRAIALELATDAIAELPQFKGQGPLHKHIVRQAWGILITQQDWRVLATARVTCGRVLGRLGDPRQGVGTLPPDMVPIEGGAFTMGEDIQNHAVTVAPFQIARYPLTNAQYKQFIDNDGYNPNMPWWDAAGRAWLRCKGYTQPRYWHDKRFGIAYENHPVVGISLYEAIAFCRWLTQHRDYHSNGLEQSVYLLPSEAEWEFVARHTTRRTYPWGNMAPDAERANYYRIYNGTTAVGCFPTGATPEEGVYDLAGNMWEWTRSSYRAYPYHDHANDGQESMDMCKEKRFILRGGGWGDQADYLCAALRRHYTPNVRYFSVGFRLAWHVT